MLNLILSVYDYTATFFSIVLLSYIFRFFFSNCIINNTIIRDNKFKTVSSLKFGLASSYLFIITTLYYTLSVQTLLSFLALMLLFSLWSSESSNIIKTLSKYDNHESIKPLSIFMFRSINSIMKVLTPIHLLIDYNVKKAITNLLSVINKRIMSGNDLNNILNMLSQINNTKIIKNTVIDSDSNDKSTSDNTYSTSKSSKSSKSSDSSDSINIIESNNNDDNLEAYYVNESECSEPVKESSNTTNTTKKDSSIDSGSSESNSESNESSEVLSGDKLLDRINEVINKKFS
jgi:hypothetical protein